MDQQKACELGEGGGGIEMEGVFGIFQHFGGRVTALNHGI